MKMLDFVAVDAIVSELQATERDEVIAELVESVVASGVVAASLKDELIKSIIERETHGTTGLGKGVAVPHVKHESIKKMAATIGISQAGVDFNALDRAPVYSIVLLFSPKNNPNEHLQAMETVVSNLQNDTFRKFLRQACTKEAVIDLLEEADSQTLNG